MNGRRGLGTDTAGTGSTEATMADRENPWSNNGPSRRRFLGAALGFAAGMLVADRWAAFAAAPARATPEAGCRPVVHPLGEACVPNDPRRVVTLDPVTLEHLVALGVAPVGHPLDGGVAPHLRPVLAEVESLGTYGEPSLETIARLSPDLIVVWNPFANEISDELAQIAPTVVTDRQGFDDWPGDLTFVASLVGKEDEATRLLADYEARIDALRVRIAADPAPPVVSTITFTGGAGGRVLTRNSFSGVVLSSLGLQQPPAQDVEAPFGFLDLSAERIPDLDGDLIFVIAGIFDERETEDQRALRLQIEGSPLWQRLGAVQRGEVHAVSAGHWYQGSVLSAHLVLDDLERYLSIDSATPEATA